LIVRRACLKIDPTPQQGTQAVSITSGTFRARIPRTPPADTRRLAA
jgi:hypothetical protein